MRFSQGSLHKLRSRQDFLSAALAKHWSRTPASPWHMSTLHCFRTIDCKGVTPSWNTKTTSTRWGLEKQNLSWRSCPQKSTSELRLFTSLERKTLGCERCERNAHQMYQHVGSVKRWTSYHLHPEVLKSDGWDLDTTFPRKMTLGDHLSNSAWAVGKAQQYQKDQKHRNPADAHLCNERVQMPPAAGKVKESRLAKTSEINGPIIVGHNSQGFIPLHDKFLRCRNSGNQWIKSALPTKNLEPPGTPHPFQFFGTKKPKRQYNPQGWHPRGTPRLRGGCSGCTTSWHRPKRRFCFVCCWLTAK